MKTEQNNDLNFKDIDYEAISERPNYMTNIYKKLIKKINIESILDVGCGNGHFSQFFIDRKFTIDGVDGHKGALKKCQSLGFRNCFYTKNIDEDNLSQVNETYDLIICKDLLEHLLYPDKLLKTLERKLKKNGHILIHVPNHFPLYFRFKFLFTGDLDTQKFFIDRKEWENPHIKYFTHKGFLEMIHSCSLEKVEDFSSEFFYSAPYFVSSMKKIKIDKVLMKLSPTLFTTGFTILAKKITKQNDPLPRAN
ncbi:class I SAM-dependent methyltransferase [Bacteriovoracales bacterium]|nr:class I SAM-dependent methyltransferase [Bacteriovoracales bacterium]